MKILLVEDDALLARSLAETVQSASHIVDHVRTGAATGRGRAIPLLPRGPVQQKQQCFPLCAFVEKLAQF